jgi:hypothetical protein
MNKVWDIHMQCPKHHAIDELGKTYKLLWRLCMLSKKERENITGYQTLTLIQAASGVLRFRCLLQGWDPKMIPAPAENKIRRFAL